MSNEKSWGYERWMASGVVGAVLTVGAVWYVVTNISMSSAEASAKSASLAGLSGLSSSATPILNRVLLTPHPDDSLIIQAYNAFQAKDSTTLRVLVDRPTDHPLRDYIGYWYWKRMLDESLLTTTFNDSIQAWLADHPGTVLAERLRQDWLKKQLANVTPRFLPEYDLLSRPDDELTCAVWLLRGQPESAKGDEARLWAAPKEQSPACEQWLGMRAQHGEWTRFRYRLYLAAVSGNARGIGRMAALSLIAPPADLVNLYANPAQWLRKRPHLDTVWDIVALLRLASIKTGRDQVRPLLERVDASLQKEANTFIGYALGKHLQPESAEYFQQGLLTAELPGDVLIWRLRTFLRNGQWSEVLQTAQIAPAKLKEQDSAWRYWAARALSEAQRDAEARPIYEALAAEPHYYGVLARETLGGGWEVPAAPSMPTQKDVTDIASEPGIQRALILARLDWRDEGRREWQWTLRTAKDEQLNAAAYVAWQYQHYDWAINTATQTKFDHNLNLRFIAPYQGIAEEAGQQFQISSAWVLGVIRQESRFYPRARSWVGAMGLMQLMPATAAEIARKTGLPGSELSALLDPDINIPMGTYYMSEQLERLGSPVKVTVAYNAGASRARAWQAAEPLEGAVYVESIPFSETREYVKRVLSNWYFYHRVLGNKKTLSLTKILGTIPPRGEKGSPWAEDDPIVSANQ